MKLILEKDRIKISIKIFFVWFLAYFGTKFFNGLIKADAYPVYIFPIESSIPYVPEFFPIYFLAVPVAILPAFIIKGKKLFDRVIKTYLITIVTTGVLFLLYPTKIPRPLIVEEGVYYQMIQFFYNIIPSYNLIPSFHMSLMILSSLFIREENEKLGNVLMVLVLIIAVSILLVKEHYLLDLIVGFILSVVIYYIVKCK